MATTKSLLFPTVYGPVSSWRYGRSLGIDPIGEISTCSFNCVYCQLGEIENITQERKVYIPTQQILEDLKPFKPWLVDIITISGSGEPTLAANLGEIIQEVKRLTNRSILVLTNGTLLKNPQVQEDLKQVDKLSVKLDAVNPKLLEGINRPVENLHWEEMRSSLIQFRKQYEGEFAIQTMVLAPWSEQIMADYLALIKPLHPDTIHLNLPTRPKPLKRQLDGRGNHSPEDHRPYAVQQLNCLPKAVIEKMAQAIEQETRIPVKMPR